jgi:stage II sporulation protein AB (anti-sigma F factor)
MGMGNWFELRFPALSVNERFSRSVAASFASQLADWTVPELNEITTAVSEAVTNAIIHGYEDGPGEVVLRGKVGDRQLVLEIEDGGRGIKDIAQAREPLFTTKAAAERTGMGFTLMEGLMDEVLVFSAPEQGTTVRLIKYLVSEMS